MEREPVLGEVLRRRMAVTEIAAATGLSRAAVSQWKRVPERHLAIVAKLTRISKRRLRPDLYLVREREAAE